MKKSRLMRKVDEVAVFDGVRATALLTGLATQAHVASGDKIVYNRGHDLSRFIFDAGHPFLGRGAEGVQRSRRSSPR